MIPTKIVIDGDTLIGQKYIGIAKSKIRTLFHELRLRSKATPGGDLKQLARVFTINKDVKIECWISFGLSQARIVVEGGAPEEDKLCPECMCGCHVSVGVVAFSQPVNCLDHILDLQFVYDVIVCHEKTKYIQLTGCQPMDFTKYIDGELVYILWVPDPPETYAGNTDAGCIMEASSWGRILSVKPSNHKMDMWPC